MEILGISGSLRASSFNTGLLRAAQELAPAGMRITLYEGMGELPLYNQDVEAQGIPAPVARLKQAIADAQALLIATPEYNYGVAGVLKNAIDWVSRPPATTPLKGKLTGLIGAGGGQGTARAQLSLRQSFVFTETYTMLKPELLVAQAWDKFDKAGNLTDAATREHLTKYLVAFEKWVQRFS